MTPPVHKGPETCPDFRDICTLNDACMCLLQVRLQVAECMPYKGPGPRLASDLPKRKKDRGKKKQECIPMMMALLACYKANSYARMSIHA